MQLEQQVVQLRFMHVDVNRSAKYSKGGWCVARFGQKMWDHQNECTRGREMRKVFMATFALISFGYLSPVSAEPPSVESLCSSAATRCTNNCDYGKTHDACFSACVDGFRDCLHKNAQIQIRGPKKGSAGGSLKNFSGAAGGTTAGPNSHIVGAAANGMSAMPGAAVATPPAASSRTNDGAVTNSGTISTNNGAVSNSGSANNGGAVTNSGVIMGHRGSAGGGNGLLSGPGMPRLKAQ
jgi:hypothetical protein